ncbi:MAG: ATP-binding cassette domain-containing protein [Firmicutes bacterium]|nr:ATP-binding cassette domain-containing protein [Bacillota bacterium]
MSAKTVVEVKNLSHIYQPMGEVALKNVDLTIKEGEFVAIIGQNGSGKTTLIKHLNGLLKATKGEVVVGGKLITDQKVSDMAHYIGYVFQNPEHQIFAETVEEEVAFGPKNLGFPPEKIKAMVDKSLGSLGLSHHRETMPFMLGRGEMQRLAVASILSMDPQVLIIDEPTTGLDWHECVQVMDLVKELNERGHTIIMTTHNMSIVSLYAKRVVVLRLGEKILDGPTEEVFRETEILKTAFIKAPQIFRLMSKFPEIELDNYGIDHVAEKIYHYMKGAE